MVGGWDSDSPWHKVLVLLAHEEGVLVEVKALAEVAYQALETYEEIVATEMVGLDGY